MSRILRHVRYNQWITFIQNSADSDRCCLQTYHEQIRKKSHHSQTCLNILMVQSCTNINGFIEMGSQKWMVPNSSSKYELGIIFEGWNKMVIL